MKYLLTLITVIAAAFGAYIFSSTSADPARHPPRVLDIRLGESVREFMALNDLKEGPGGLRQYTIAIDRHDDWMSLYFTDVWVAVHYKENGFDLDLPPGRILAVGQEAGIITDFDVKLHEQPLPFEQADKQARAMIERLLKSGWKEKFRFYPKDQTDSNTTSNGKVYAELVSASGNELIYSLMDVSQTPRFDVNIPGSAPMTPTDPTPRFLARVEIWAPKTLRDRQSDLLRARRFAVGGQNSRRLSLRVWLDEPDWTPEAHGMKQVEVPNKYWNPQKPWLGKRIVKRWQMPDGTIEP